MHLIRRVLITNNYEFLRHSERLPPQNQTRNNASRLPIFCCSRRRGYCLILTEYDPEVSISRLRIPEAAFTRYAISLLGTAPQIHLGIRSPPPGGERQTRPAGWAG